MISIAKKSFIGASIGTLLEYYDVGLWPIFVTFFAPAYFGGDAYSALMKSYVILLATGLARPIGGLVFGHYGDRWGRSRVLIFSLYAIAISTFVLGIIPDCKTIGIFAIILATLARVVQLFAFGGEYNGAGIYVVEQQTQRAGLIGSLLTASCLFGLLLASLVGFICSLSFMPTRSWRLGFMFGGVIGLVGIMYRKNIVESAHFRPANPINHSLKNMFKRYPLQLIAGVFIGGFSCAAFTTAIMFINPVLMAKGLMTREQLMVIQVFLTLTAIITLVVAGQQSDKKTPFKLIQFGSLALIFLSYPLLFWLDSGKFLGLILAQMILIIINEIVLGASNAYFKTLFIMQYRYRATSLSFCTGMALFGSLTPFVENYFYRLTGHFVASSIWLIFVGLGTAISVYLAENSKHVEIAAEAKIIL